MAAAAGVSSRLRVPVFAFLFVKIRMQSSCRYVRLVAGTCFCFSNFKNYNARTAAAGVPGWSHIPECFCFFACKNCNTGAVVPAAGMPAAGAFLFNIFLAVFAFFDCKRGCSSCKCDRLVVCTCFRFFTCKNRNSEVRLQLLLLFQL